MSRKAIGSIIEDEIQRIELSYLLKHNFLKKGIKTSATLSWTNNDSIKIICRYTSEEISIELLYHNTYKFSGNVSNHNYKIYLNEVPSNLGNGNVLYFSCPITGRNCKILYRCYGSLIFKSRYAYQKRIYYRSQVACKKDYANTMYWKYKETILPKLEERIKKKHYRGKPTKAQKDYENALYKKREYDNMRFFNMMDCGLRTLKKN
jgi:hypothetical protein